MEFDLNTDQQDIQRTARDLLSTRSTFERVRTIAEAGACDDDLYAEMVELGWPGIAIAEEHGGQGLGVIELSLLCEELGRTVAAVPFLPTVTCALVIQHAGTDEQRAAWLPKLASGEITGALGRPDQLVVGAGRAGVIVVLDDSGARLVARQDAEVTPVDAIDPTRRHARVAAGGGEPLGGDVAGGVDRALVAIAAELVGVCSRALEMTLDYVKERKQFGTPVGAYQAVSHKVAQMLLDTERARAATSFAAWAADADPGRLSEAAAMAKAAASEAGRSVTDSAVQAHGGIGFTWEADVHWLLKRAQVDSVLLGSAGEHRARLARLIAR